MTAILGVSAFYHDSAAALVVGGEIVAAAQEERFTRKKHDASYPRNAIEYVLKEGRRRLRDVDYVAPTRPESFTSAPRPVAWG